MNASIVIVVCALFFGFFAEAGAAETSMRKDLPFRIKIGEVSEVVMNGSHYTVIDVTLTNGEYFLNELAIHCNAHNSQMLAWDVTGQATNVSPHEKRQFRAISSSGDESGDFTKPTQVKCELKTIAIGFM